MIVAGLSSVTVGEHLPDAPVTVQVVTVCAAELPAATSAPAAMHTAMRVRIMATERGARTMALEVMSDPARALAEKVREELKIGEAHTTPLREGWITGSATAVGALIPVAPFFFFTGAPAIWTSFTLAMASHFAVGAARSLFTGRGIFRSGVDMFAVGLGVAAVGYIVGGLVAKLL